MSTVIVAEASFLPVSAIRRSVPIADLRRSICRTMKSRATARVPVVSPLTWLWTISGSMITLALYQKRKPLAWMDASIGARIGVVVGLALVSCLAIAMAGAGLVARFGLHNM